MLPALLVILCTHSRKLNPSITQIGTDAYIAAQTAGQANFTGLSSTVTYLENDKTTVFKSGIISIPLKPDHIKFYYDLTECSTYTELIITDTKNPHVIGTALRWSGGQIGSVQSIVTKTGDWLFNATGTLSYATKESWTTMPETQRDARAVIKAAADAYLDPFNNKSTVVPWGSPCARLEGGDYITSSCNVGVPSGLELTKRMYVLDESVSAVDVMFRFGGVMGLPDSHEFRIEAGKIRYVHTMSVQTAWVKN